MVKFVPGMGYVFDAAEMAERKAQRDIADAEFRKRFPEPLNPDKFMDEFGDQNF